MKRIDGTTSREALAALVSEALRDAGLDAVLVGGSVVSLYTKELFPSDDLDFASWKTMKEARPALEKLGFTRSREIGRSIPRLTITSSSLERLSRSAIESYKSPLSEKRNGVEFCCSPRLPRERRLAVHPGRRRLHWEAAMIPTKRTPAHPGEILREEFLVPLGMSRTWASRRSGSTSSSTVGGASRPRWPGCSAARSAWDLSSG